MRFPGNAALRLVALLAIGAVVATYTRLGRRSPEERQGDARPAVRHDARLRAELLRRRVADQAVREEFAAAFRSGATPDSAVMLRMLATDRENTAWLAEVVDSLGWPGRSMVGDDGAEAAFLIVQHADDDTAFQARVLPRLAAAHRAGEVPGGQVAMLTDRLESARGHPQRYGTQADLRDGRIVLKPIADSAGVDARRAAMGMPPLQEYMRVMDSVYGRPGKR